MPFPTTTDKGLGVLECVTASFVTVEQCKMHLWWGIFPRDVPIVQHPCRCAATGRTEQGGRREPVMNRLQFPISPPFLPARINITVECIMLLHQLWDRTDLGYNCCLVEVVQYSVKYSVQYSA